MDHQMFESKVAERAGVPPDQAQALIRATLQTLAERITGGEAHDLAAQLPKQMKEWLEKDPGAPAESFGLEEFIRRVSELRLTPGGSVVEMPNAFVYGLASADIDLVGA